MRHPELDYTVPNRGLVYAWLVLAVAALTAGFWFYPVWVMLLFLAAIFLWTNFYSTAMHYALDAEEFTTLPVVGGAFVRFQGHHFPARINTIYRKPMLDLVGELNPLVLINAVCALALYRFAGFEVFVVWAALMLVGGYAMICHRWAHEPDKTKPRVARVLQRAHLALSPAEHWKHHALAVMPNGQFVPNFDLSFGWSNPVFNRLFKKVPSPRLWIAILAIATLAQVGAFAVLLHWMRSRV